MCSRLHLGALLAALLLALVVRPAASRAQVSTEELERRIESLRPGVEAARRTAAEARARRDAEDAERNRTPLDTVQVGPLRVVTLPDEAELAAQLFGEVWRESFANVSAGPVARQWLITFQWRGLLEPIPVVVDPPLVRQLHVRRVWEPTREGLQVRIRQVIATVLTEDFDQRSPMRSWLATRGHPSPERVYRLLVATPAAAHRACLRGEAPACWAALGLGLRGAGDRLSEWFSMEDRQRMVEGAYNAAVLRDRDDPDFRGCVEDGSAQACDRVLLSSVDWATDVPLPNPAAAHMLWHAVRVGGEGAWDRALERRDSPPPELLTHVAGLDAEALAASWRAEVMAHPPEVHADLGRTRWTVLFWCVVLLGLTMRSTRWRLG